MEISVFPLDCCLACERQTSGEAYCSQVCRLADLESPGPSSYASAPPSPTEPHTPSSAGMLSSRGPSTGLFLPPAFDFSAYRRPAASPTTSRPPSSYIHTTSSSPSSTSPRILTPSSSHSSLKSTPTLAVYRESISSQAKSELRQYTNSFDQVRDLRRHRGMST